VSNAAFTPGHNVARKHVSGRATCIWIHICRRIHVSRSGYMLPASRQHNYYSFMPRSTCIPLYPATDGQKTGDNFVADASNMLTATSGYKWIQLVSSTCCLLPACCWCHIIFSPSEKYAPGAWWYIGRYKSAPSWKCRPHYDKIAPLWKIGRSAQEECAPV